MNEIMEEITHLHAEKCAKLFEVPTQTYCFQSSGFDRPCQHHQASGGFYAPCHVTHSKVAPYHSLSLLLFLTELGIASA